MKKKNAIKITAISLFGAFLAACGNQQDFAEKKAGVEVECFTEKDDGRNNVVEIYDLDEILSHTPLAQDFRKALLRKKTAVCLGDLETGTSHEFYSGKKVLIIDKNTRVQHIALERMRDDLADNANREFAQSDAYLNPEDSLIFDRMSYAQAQTAFISHIYNQYGLGSNMWNALKQADGYQEAAALFEEERKKTYHSDSAMRATFEYIYAQRSQMLNADMSHLSWYSDRLRPRSEMAPSMCMKFHGENGMSLDPCLKPVTVNPPSSIGKSKLNAEHLVTLSGGLLANEQTFFSNEDAASFIEKARQDLKQDPNLAASLQTLNTSLETCCDGSRDGSVFGFGGRGWGLAL